MFAPPRRSEDAVLQARVIELYHTGYITHEQGRWYLTEKGWRTLSAAAERKQARPPKPTRQQIETELKRYEHARTSVGR